MNEQGPTNLYGNEVKSIRDWLGMISANQIALPSYQRSYGCKIGDAFQTDYLKALLQKRPTGTFMALKFDSERHTQATYRSIDSEKRKISTEHITHLLLDGQQRLKSLWEMLHVKNARKFYVEVDGMNQDSFLSGNDELNINVFFDGRKRNENSVTPQEESRRAKEDYNRNRIPAYLLGPNSDKERVIWCRNALGSGNLNVQDCDPFEVYDKLRIAIENKLYWPLNNYQVPYFELSGISQDQAINIFIETNKSMTKVSEFDIAAAGAEKKYGVLVRDQIAAFYSKSEHLKVHYPGDEDEYIPKIGEWLLKVVCLKVNSTTDSGVLPAKTNYENALIKLLGEKCSDCKGKNCKDTQCKMVEKLLHNLEDTLTHAAEYYGGAIRRTLACDPPFHVLAALQDTIKAMDPSRKSANNMSARDKSGNYYIAQELVHAYIWRSFFSDRYNARANSYLLTDFREILKCLNDIEKGGKYDKSKLTIFEKYDLPTVDMLKDLEEPWGVFGASSKKGRKIRAIIAIVICDRASRDWADGRIFLPNTIRELEERKQDKNCKLHFHHIFPKTLFKDQPKDYANHVLNFTLLTGLTNTIIGGDDPKIYLPKLESNGRTKKTIVDFLKTHYVPGSLGSNSGTVNQRYERFIEERAVMLFTRIDRKANLKQIKNNDKSKRK